MSVNGQIIPRYLHPSDTVQINDNTTYTDYTSDNTGIVRYLCLFASPKGRTKLQKFTNLTEWLEEYGNPDYRLYGQASYMPYTMLSTGYASCQCLRVVAEDSTYANLILVVGYKNNGGKLSLKFKVFSQSDLRTTDDLTTIANSLETTVADGDGYKWLPIATFWSLGRGIYGNDFRVRITHDKASDKENKYKNYNFSILSTEEDATLLEKFNVSFYIDATDPLTKKSIYIDEVVNDEDGNGSQKVNMEFFHDNYVKLFDQYVSIYNGTASTTKTEKVNRLPSITAPSSTVLYVLTQKDTVANKEAGNYIYNSVSGQYEASAITIQDVATLPAIGNMKTNTYYHVTTGDASAAAGTYWYKASDDSQNPSQLAVENYPQTVTELPNTQVYTPGTVYELTQAEGTKNAGTLWTVDESSKTYVAYTAPAAEEKEPLDLTIETWDMFGYNRVTGEMDTHMEIADGASSITIMNIEGIALQNGSDGSMAEDQPTATREASYEAAFASALGGKLDRMILNKRRTPVEQMYDANLSVNLKKAMATLAIQRGDMMVFLDCGLLQTTADLKSLASTLTSSTDTYLVSLNSGMMYTNDPITGKNIPVSILLWMASAYPVHVANYGWYTPFAGERYAIISGYSSNKKIKPVYDEDLDADTLEELYADYHINYIQALDEDTFVRGTQITSQHKTSDLSKENNVMVTLEIKRKIERMISRNRYNWTDAQAIKNFKDDCTQVFSSYAGTRCESLSIDVKQSTWEKTRYILHAYLEVSFRKYQERGIVEIDLNPSSTASI